MSAGLGDLFATPGKVIKELETKNENLELIYEETQKLRDMADMLRQEGYSLTADGLNNASSIIEACLADERVTHNAKVRGASNER